MEKEISKTKIKKNLRKKTNPELTETIRLAFKNRSWLPLARFLSSSTRKYASVNLSEIEKRTSAGDTILVPGRVLSSGNLTKKVRICAVGISTNALTKLKETKSVYASIKDEIKSNPKAEGIKTIR